MDEDAGLHVAAGVDVAVRTAAGDAAAHVLAVVLEVHGEDGLATLDGTDLADAVEHVLALLDRGHEVGIGAVADGHVVEVPRIAAALGDDQVHELVGRDALDVGAGIAGGRAVEQAVLVHEVEGIHDLLERALAATAVVDRGLIGLERHGEDDVTETLDLLAERLVDEAGVGEDVEEAVVVRLGELEDVRLADEGLAAGEHEQVRTQGLGLGHELVHLVIGEVEAVAVLGSPAAHAMLVAGGRGIEEDDPGHVALVLDGVFGGVAKAAEGRLVAAGQNRGAQNVGVGLVDDGEQVLLPLRTGVDGGLHATRGAGVGVLEELGCHVEELHDVLFAIRTRHGLEGLVERDLEGLALCRVCDL